MREAITQFQEQQNLANIDAIVRDFYLQFKPKPRLYPDEFAERHLYLTAGTAEKGLINLDRTPHIRGILRAAVDPIVHVIIIVTCSQIAKSTGLNILACYFIDQDPSDILFMQPTIHDAMDYSRRRFYPMLRDSPKMAELFDFKSRDSSNTITEKFAKNGATLTFVGSNSVSGLSGKPIKVLIGDEIDRYMATKEGSNLQLGMKRTVTFDDYKHIFTTTPGEKGLSASESLLEMSDKRQFNIPCAACKEKIVLDFKHVVWDKTPEGKHLPETAMYCCQKCGSLLNDMQIKDAMKYGEWIATQPFNGIAGFCDFPELYSPWRKMSQTVSDFLACKNDDDMLRVWVNTALGQYWEQKSERVDSNELYERREVYNLVVPREACYITCAADIQKDRIEALAVAWGFDEEAWIMEHWVRSGDTSELTKNLKKNDVNQMTFDQVGEFIAMEKIEGVWKQFDDFRKTSYDHESGELLRIGISALDTGYETDQVYNYVKPRERENVCAIKGVPGVGKPAVDRPSRKNKGKVNLYSVGTFTVKDSMKARLGKNSPGPGYIHIPDRVDKEFCDQLASEKKVIKEVHGQKKVEWVKTRPRNEAWDLLCYNFAALRIRFQTRDDLNKYANNFMGRVIEKQQNIKSAPAFQRRVFSRGIDQNG